MEVNNEVNEDSNQVLIKTYEEKLQKITDEFTAKLAEKDKLIKDIISGTQKNIQEDTIYERVVKKVNKFRGVN